MLCNARSRIYKACDYCGMVYYTSVAFIHYKVANLQEIYAGDLLTLETGRINPVLFFKVPVKGMCYGPGIGPGRGRIVPPLYFKIIIKGSSACMKTLGDKIGAVAAECLIFCEISVGRIGSCSVGKSIIDCSTPGIGALHIFHKFIYLFNFFFKPYIICINLCICSL